MTELLEGWTSTLATDCQCLIEDEDTGEEVTPDSCMDCGEWMLEDAHMTIEEWQTRNGNPEAALITGANLTWQRLSGYSVARGYSHEAITKAILKRLMLDADFRLELKLEGKELTAKRWSHDEPMGCSFRVKAFTPCDGWSECYAVGEDLKEYEEYDNRVFCEFHADIESVN
jgi:hypothetical protein